MYILPISGLGYPTGADPRIETGQREDIMAAYAQVDDTDYTVSNNSPLYSSGFMK